MGYVENHNYEVGIKTFPEPSRQDGGSKPKTGGNK